MAAAAVLALGIAPQMAASQTVPRLDVAGERAATDWAERHLVQEDWTQVGLNGRTFWFVSSLPVEAGDSPLVQDWVRTEYGDAGNHGSLSTLMRIEVDCRRQRSRVIEFYHYKDNNLRGAFFISDAPTSELEASKPGTIHRSYVEAICRGVR